MYHSLSLSSPLLLSALDQRYIYRECFGSIPCGGIDTHTKMSRWIRPEVYPLVAAMAFVSGICVFSLSRHLIVNPDVRVSKAKRTAVMLDQAVEGEKYAKHGFREYLSTKHPGVPGIFPSPINFKDKE